MTKTNESGRSMVEMLGVLAIIGVLSVGGIMGYTTAMRKYKANEIAQAITMTVMAAKSSNLGTGVMTASNYKQLTGESGLPQGAVNIDATVDADSKFNAISLKTDTTELCQAVAAIIGTDANQPMHVPAAGCGSGNTVVITVNQN